MTVAEKRDHVIMFYMKLAWKHENNARKASSVHGMNTHIELANRRRKEAGHFTRTATRQEVEKRYRELTS